MKYFVLILTLAFCLTQTFAGNVDHNISTNPNKVTQSSGYDVPSNPVVVTLSQTTSQVPVAGSVSCNAGGIHTDNSYFRAYTLANYGITADFNITAVQIGIEQASNGPQPVTVKLYTSSQVFPAGYPGSLTQIGTATVQVANQQLTLLDIPVTATAPAGSQVVVEVFTPDGTTGQYSFFIGSNAAGQTAPGYIMASSCGITVPTSTATIGFPSMHMIINLKGEQVIPVELTSFTGSCSKGQVVLNWNTATETNNKGFEIERKSGNNFVAIGYVSGHGTTTEKQSYSFSDKNYSEGVNVYRLKQVDFNGSYSFSGEIEVASVPSEFAISQNYPNPFNPSTTVKFSLAADSKVNLKVFNTLGQEIADLVNGTVTAGSHEVNFNASSLPSGIYICRISASGVDGSNFTSAIKMTLSK